MILTKELATGVISLPTKFLNNSVHLCNLFFGVLLLINSAALFFFDIPFTLFPKEPAWYVIINIDYKIADCYTNIDYVITACYINTDHTITACAHQYLLYNNNLLHQYRPYNNRLLHLYRLYNNRLLHLYRLYNNSLLYQTRQ